MIVRLRLLVFGMLSYAQVTVKVLLGWPALHRIPVPDQSERELQVVVDWLVSALPIRLRLALSILRSKEAVQKFIKTMSLSVWHFSTLPTHELIEKYRYLDLQL